jgi:DNA-binding NarL/FixJ family response regulator
MTKPLALHERRVVRELHGGYLNKQIAWRLNLAEGTVKMYLQHVKNKLHVNSRVEIALWAERNPELAGLTPTVEQDQAA